MDLGLTGRVALVAAGTSGLGLGTAVALAAEGADVSLCGRDPDRLAAAAKTVDDAGPGRVLASSVDVLDEAAVAAWVDATVAELCALHVVVTNGAGPPPGPVTAFGLADYRRALETSLLPHIGLALAALPHLRAAGWGRLLMIASETVKQPIPRYGLSNVVRVGLVGFAKSLVAEIGAAGVTVNVLAPGYHRTPAVEGQFGADPTARLVEFTSGIPLGRLGDPADFGAVAAFLASTQASFVTGEVLLVDGGSHRGIG
ncbi:MAG TPA: SDR family oxidoreductase [Pseudonocardiaceae bacterium]|jgi:3-oxoacyl-[acyl-carrier protein] reductase|nr:SDR family oxidoreductase [Pseudonocardiaceae bacterium]